MHIRLVRQVFRDSCTHGAIYIDGKFQCFTLEDTVRGDGDPATVGQWKQPKITAIPYGTYEIKTRVWQKHQKLVPWLQNVPGYEYVYIHWGNWAKDTDGCILVGQARGIDTDSIGNSQKAFEPLMGKILEALTKGEKVEIEICRSSSR